MGDRESGVCIIKYNEEIYRNFKDLALSSIDSEVPDTHEYSLLFL